MTRILALLIYGCAMTTAVGQTRIIFDTDIAPDYDDVGALAMLHAFADRGEISLLATISCNTFETTAATLSVINTYFGRPDLPIGITKGSTPYKKCDQQWAEFIVARYPHKITQNAQASEAVDLYRAILSKQPDASVVIVSVGFFTNLAALMNSLGDRHSPLRGRELISQKVKQLVSMAARENGHEFNVVVDTPASQKVFEEWPTPVLLSGFEIGEKVLTGIRLTHSSDIQKSPVKDAYQVALTKDQNTQGRNSWDQTAVWVAVRGVAPYFTLQRINFKIENDGRSVVVAGDKFGYLRFEKSPEEIALAIEELMMHLPSEK